MVDWSRNLIPVKDFKDSNVREACSLLKHNLAEGEYLIIDARGAFFKFDEVELDNFEKHNVYIGKKKDYQGFLIVLIG